MGLFRGLTVVLIGFFAISLLKGDNLESIKKIPLIGELISNNVEKYTPEIVTIAIALVSSII